MAKGYDKLPPILGPLDASMIGIGAMIGAGIFVLLGLAANMLDLLLQREVFIAVRFFSYPL